MYYTVINMVAKVHWNVVTDMIVERQTNLNPRFVLCILIQYYYSLFLLDLFVFPSASCLPWLLLFY
jgi:hypothetical protein